MKITVVKEFTFDAAHWLPNYPGLCANLHGHTYRLQIGISGKIDPNTGMVYDFAKLKELVQYHITKHLDHICLNECTEPGFPAKMPTAENMVDWIVGCFQGKEENLQLVRLWETPTSYAEWRAE